MSKDMEFLQAHNHAESGTPIVGIEIPFLLSRVHAIMTT